jgi:hypothetical protein
MAQDRIHIVPHENGWAVKREGKSDAESVHPTQKEAIEAGRDLAQKSEADLVVHRTDGTFRKVYSIGGEESEEMSERESNGGNRATGNGRGTRPRLETDDVVSVGSRISWGAVLAGASVALALMFTLGTLSTAIGLSVKDATSGRALFAGAVICSLVTVVASLFVGGFVVSRITAGEDKTEALTYGVVLWGVMFAITAALATTGTSLGLNALSTASEARATLPSDTARSLTPSKESVDSLNAKVEDAVPAVNPKTAAWWTFVGVIVSIAAAILGSIAGAGPTLVLRQFRERRSAVPVTRTQLQTQAHT